MFSDKYKEFLRIAKVLNKELGIAPVLYGSLGLSKILNKDLQPEDIDILVPQKFIASEWKKLQAILNSIGYKLIDEKEHEFVCKNYKIGIFYEEDLYPFAGVDYKKLDRISDAGVKYKLLNLEQYKKVYTASQKDSYRSDKNNGKDVGKIRIINENI